MDKEVRERKASTSKYPSKFEFAVNPGMEQGAGDSAAPSFVAAGGAAAAASSSSSECIDRRNSLEGSSVTSASDPRYAENLALLQEHMSKLHLPKSSHGSDGISDMGYDYDDEESSEEEEGEIEPLCSYPYGYLKRQTVYVCLTCNDPTKDDWKPAGVCIGCRHSCHQSHTVISMETRRNFRCDCGNKKFPEGTKCLLFQDKEDINEHNIYNNNFKGTFCTCNCKEAECVEDDPLYQCVVCEDWFHANHCNVKAEGIEKNYTDLICGDCTAKLDFLRYYEPFDPNMQITEAALEEMMKYTDNDEDDEDEESSITDETCKLDTLVKKDPYQKGHLWTLGWRGKLCRCTKCKEMYASLNVSFLLDREDETRRYFDDEEDEDTHQKICAAIQKFEEWLLKMEPSERDEMFGAGLDVVKAKLKDHFSHLLASAKQQPKEAGPDEDVAEPVIGDDAGAIGGAEVATGAGSGDQENMDLEGLKDFLMDDQLLDQLLQAFTEFVLDAEDGTDYLLDVDAFHKIFAKATGTPGESSENPELDQPQDNENSAEQQQ